MDKLEKAINGMEYCIKRMTTTGECDYDCPYYHNPHGCKVVMLKDAISLLKEQEPRVMTITEAFDAEVAWLERYADPDDAVEPIIQPVIIRHYENGYWECLIEQDESAALTLFIEDFGTEFRFWTSRPTEEQRKAVKFDG